MESPALKDRKPQVLRRITSSARIVDYRELWQSRPRKSSAILPRRGMGQVDREPLRSNVNKDVKERLGNMVDCGGTGAHAGRAGVWIAAIRGPSTRRGKLARSVVWAALSDIPNTCA